MDVNYLEETLMTVREASLLLGVHPNTLRRWTNDGIIMAYRIGPRNERRFRRQDVEALLK